MRKIYILDTNIILHDPLSFYSFEGNDVVIPLYVIEELDNFKENQDALGQNARMFSRRMDDYMSEGGDLSKGIFIDDHDISLLVESNKKIEVELPQELSISKKDNSILSVAIYYNNKFDEEVILVSNDTNLKIKANSIGLKIESYKSNAVELETLYKGYKDIDTVSQEDVDLLHKKDKLKINIEDAQPNEVYNIKTNKSSTLSIYKKNYLHKLDHDIYAWGINANNREQNYGLNLLMDKDIDLVSLVGKAGTGKTLLSLAAGLEQVVNRKEYTKLVILRPIIPMGKDIGYLPGDEQEKLSAWMRPIKDNLEFLLSGQDKDISQSYIDNYISMEALTYIRGRSIPNQFIIVDECFPYNQKVLTEIGKKSIGSLYVRYIRENKTMPKVKSFNEDTGEYEWKNIINMQHNGKKELIKIKANKKEIKCTASHPFLTDKGWKPAIELKNGDNLLMHGNNQSTVSALNDDQLQVVYGSYIGDGNLTKLSEGSYRLKFIHSGKQKKYLEFKSEIFNRKNSIKLLENNGYASNTAYTFATKAFSLPTKFNGEKNKNIDENLLNLLDERGLAIWYMDDGSLDKRSSTIRFNTQAFTKKANKKIQKMLLKKFNIDSKLMKTKDKYYVININKVNSKKIFKLISKYIHDELKYKLPEKYRETKNIYNWNNEYKKYRVSTVTDIILTGEKEHVFNMEVEDNHNYIANIGSNNKENENGFIVHNCQNLTSHEAKTILTRAGKGSKVVFTGDPNQIDHPYLDKNTNGLTYVVDKMKDSEYTGSVLLTKGERSRLAEEATNKL